MNNGTELYTVGQLARRTGLSAHTIRFWSDTGVVPPTSRSTGGYRLYDAAAVARFDLVRTLRELGIGLEAVEAILTRRTTVAEVAHVHVRALDAEIRTLKLRRAVLSTIARRGSTTEETSLMHKLARLSAVERQELVDGFIEQTFAGIDLDDDTKVVVEWMRHLPDDPAPHQVDAWLELADLVADDDFRDRVRRAATAGSALASHGLELRSTIVEHAGQALAVAPESAEGRSVLHRICDPGMPPGERRDLCRWLETVADARMERYWELLAALHGEQSPESPAVPAFRWVLAALRAHTSDDQ
ncbi:MerR family transcriptional regulator [Lentzea sp. NPDC060358]|uniref:helix-turn-helix domain-containing protein n=1 Tax=Lentzea sp. NPDC060358 TaxID=3347103 RepID=UPI0036574CC3